MDTRHAKRRRCLIAGTPTNPRDPPPIRVGQDQHATPELFRTHRLAKAGRNHRLDTLSQGTGQATLHRQPRQPCRPHRRTRTTSACRHGRVHIGTPIHDPCFEDASTRKGCRQCPADTPASGSGDAAPTITDYTNHPRPRNLQTVHTIHTQGTHIQADRPADSSRPPTPPHP